MIPLVNAHRLLPINRSATGRQVFVHRCGSYTDSVGVGSSGPQVVSDDSGRDSASSKSAVLLRGPELTNYSIFDRDCE